jgi:hypothetical protein
MAGRQRTAVDVMASLVKTITQRRAQAHAHNSSVLLQLYPALATAGGTLITIAARSFAEESVFVDALEPMTHTYTDMPDVQVGRDAQSV